MHVNTMHTILSPKLSWFLFILVAIGSPCSLNRHAPPGVWHHDPLGFAELLRGFRSIGPLGFAELLKELPFGSRPADLLRRLPEGVGQEAGT